MRSDFRRFRWALLTSLLGLAVAASAVRAQNVNNEALTRAKMWMESYEAGIPVSGSIAGCGQISYPGYQGSLKNSLNGAGSWTTGSLRAVRNDSSFVHGFDGNQYQPPWVSIGEPTKIIKNYNFVDRGIHFPEEVMEGGLISNHTGWPPGTDADNLKYILRSRSMVWSIPKYDDFVITEYTIINDDAAPFRNMFFIHSFTIQVTRQGRVGELKTQYDTEYIWDEKREIFVFYDDNSIPINTERAVVYDIAPGNVTGDVGDPGNIKSQGSIDYQLYSPQVVGHGFVNVPPNAFGESKVHHSITNYDWSLSPTGVHPTAPEAENAKWVWGTGRPNVLNLDIRSDMPSPFAYSQSKMSYRAAAQDPTTTDGGIYERWPVYAMAIGPYNLAPGESITFTRIMCAGEMDRNLAMLGGEAATQLIDMDFASEVEGASNEHASIKEFRKNWDAALELIETRNATSFYTPVAVPPPTVGNPPKMLLGDELEAEIFKSEEGESFKSGVELRWIPIPSNYVDPLTGEADFAGYKVYSSPVGIEGPWELRATINKGQENIQDGRVVFQLETDPGIPLRYGVTSFDTQGLESGMTAYTYDSITSKRAPSNDFADVRVVPNPFRQISGHPDPGQTKRLTFVNVPSQCTIRIYNLAGDLIRTIQHNDGFGEEAWGSTTDNDYMLTRFFQNVMPGLYIYQITSEVPGSEGESATGKFVVIK